MVWSKEYGSGHRCRSLEPTLSYALEQLWMDPACLNKQLPDGWSRECGFGHRSTGIYVELRGIALEGA
jgi:hypothetical protein